MINHDLWMPQRRGSDLPNMIEPLPERNKPPLLSCIDERFTQGRRFILASASRERRENKMLTSVVQW
jgi:hypothetical protein